MQLITTKEIVDVIKYNDESVIIVEKLPLPNGTQYKVQYSVINFKTKSIDVLTKNAYLLKKFGSNFNRISQIMPNFVQCDAAVLYDHLRLHPDPFPQRGILVRFYYRSCHRRHHRHRLLLAALGHRALLA